MDSQRQCHRPIVFSVARLHVEMTAFAIFFMKASELLKQFRVVQQFDLLLHQTDILTQKKAALGSCCKIKTVEFDSQLQQILLYRIRLVLVSGHRIYAISFKNLFSLH